MLLNHRVGKDIPPLFICYTLLKMPHFTSQISICCCFHKSPLILSFHFRYDQSTQKNDIALAKLERSVTFRRGLRPACLPQRFRGFPLKNLKDNPKVIGWGKTENNQPISPRLLQASVPFVDNPTCSGKYGSAIAGLDISSTQICAGDDDRDSCSGGKGPLNTILTRFSFG